jgi:hypothetical protein
MTTIYKTNVTAPNYTLGTSLGYNGTYTTAATISSNMSVGDGVLKINGSPASLEVKGTVVINGLDLEERLNTIEKVLQIPERDVILEAKHPKLKELYDQYIHALGKYRTWESIKGTKDE